MYAHLFEHETLSGGTSTRERLNRIWDAVPATGSIAEIEHEFTKRATAARFSTEQCEQFLMGGDA